MMSAKANGAVLYRLLVFTLVVCAYGSIAHANPASFSKKLPSLIKGPSDQITDKVSGFYTAKSKGYYSHIYIVLDGTNLTAVYEYKEDGKKQRGYFVGVYQPNNGYAEGAVCYEDTAEWLGKGGIAFYEAKGKTKLKIFYTETNNASDNDWKNDWGHTKTSKHSKLETLRQRYMSARIRCEASSA